MTRYYFHKVVFNTSQRLFELKGFLQILTKEIPHIQEREINALRASAEKNNWDFVDLASDEDVITSGYENIEKLITYSILTMLYSILEAQFYDCAVQLRTDRDFKIKVTEMHGKGIDRTALYLNKVAGININQEEWASIKDLQFLRNTIVHNNGRQGKSPDNLKRISGLIKKYKGKLALSPGLQNGDEELIISEEICLEFTSIVSSFLHNIYVAAGFPKEGFWAEPY